MFAAGVKLFLSLVLLGISKASFGSDGGGAVSFFSLVVGLIFLVAGVVGLLQALFG
jgi:hypothetical protein